MGDLEGACVFARKSRFAGVADLAILDPARDFPQRDAFCRAADETAIRDVEMLCFSRGEKRAAVRKRLRIAVEHETEEPDILYPLKHDERSAIAVAENGLAWNAFNAGPGFQRELGRRIDPGGKKERRTRLCRRVGSGLEGRGLVDRAAAGRDILRAAGLKEPVILRKARARSGRHGKAKPDPAQQHLAATDNHRLTHPLRSSPPLERSPGG